MPNVALCQQGPHVSTKESLANGLRVILYFSGFSRTNPDNSQISKSIGLFFIFTEGKLLKRMIKCSEPKQLEKVFTQKSQTFLILSFFPQ